jgi:uncharacterized protein (TIRG00374 family)
MTRARSGTFVRIAITCAIVAVLLWRIDVGRAASFVAHADPAPLVLALAIFVASTWALAWRWQLLLAAKGIDEPLSWLTKLYFVGQAASQILPTAIGGDAVRILEHARRRPDAKSAVAAAVLLERATGAAATFALVAIGLVLATALHERVRVFVWIELGLVAGAAAVAYLLFSKRARRHLARLAPAARRLRLDAVARSLYGALHAYRSDAAVLGYVTVVSLGLQVVRVLAIWLCAVAVGIDLSPVPFLILGPLLFLVMLVPFTINGIGVREAFFAAFLGRWHVSASAAVTAGFVFFALTAISSLPGAFVLVASRSWRQPLRPPTRRPNW